MKSILFALIILISLSARCEDNSRSNSLKRLFGISIGSSIQDGSDETKKFGRVVSESALAHHRLYYDNAANFKKKIHAKGWESDIFELAENGAPYTFEVHTSPTGQIWKLRYEQYWSQFSTPSYHAFINNLRSRLGEENYSAKLYAPNSTDVPLNSLAAWVEPADQGRSSRHYTYRPSECSTEDKPRHEQLQCVSKAIMRFSDFWTNAEQGIVGPVTLTRIRVDPQTHRLAKAEIEVYNATNAKEFQRATQQALNKNSNFDDRTVLPNTVPKF
jgi:hypothetical protein